MSRRRKRTGRSRSKVGTWCGMNKHFMFAAVILTISTGGWYVVAAISEVAFMKKPVPWPEPVEVNRATFQNTGFPLAFGTYHRAEDDELCELRGRPADEDYDPDGEITIEAETLEALKIGTALDEGRVDDRQSNWYVSRLYVDDSKKRGERFKVWRANVYYYTGVRDQIPHVPEACLAAGGATIVESSTIVFTAGDCRPPWNGPVTFRRTHWRVEHDGKLYNYVQYYVFSMNDEPVNDRNAVRFKLMWPWVKHSYYAKIEFSPDGPISAESDDDSESHNAADAAAARFVKQFLPQVIKALPTREAVNTLDSTN